MTAVERARINREAFELRGRGLSYPAIAAVMAYYYGLDRSPSAWRTVCRQQGARAVPRGWVKAGMHHPAVA